MKEAVGSGSLTVGEMATRLVWSELNIGDDKNGGLGDRSNVVWCFRGRSVLRKLCGGADRSCKKDRVDLWVRCGDQSAVARQGSGWSTWVGLRAARASNVGGLWRRVVDGDGRKRRDGHEDCGWGTEGCWRTVGDSRR